MTPEGTLRALSRDQVREIDRLAIEDLGIPGVVLMENAGINVTRSTLDLLSAGGQMRPGKLRVVVLCGGGNNGGDGYVVARHLHNRAVAVEVFALKDPAELEGDAAINHHICQRMGLPIQFLSQPEQIEEAATGWGYADGLIDALLGTGFQGEVREPMAGVIERVNHLRGPRVISVDVPSGLDCQTGQPSNTTIHATMTVTFVANKQGFRRQIAAPYLGRLVVTDIGTPPELLKRVLGA